MKKKVIHYRTWTRARLEKLFDQQIKTLIYSKVSGYDIDQLIEQRDAVIGRMINVPWRQSGGTPFLPVISLPLFELKQLLWYGGYTAYDLLIHGRQKKKVHTARRPYYIFSVQDGREMLNLSAAAAESILKEQGRSVLTLQEIVALGLHTRALYHHSVYAGGTIREPYDVIGLELDSLGVARLLWMDGHKREPKFGLASCGRERLVTN